MVKVLSPVFLETLVQEFAPSNTLGVGLLGSFARGQGTPHSDVDLDIFLAETPASPSRNLYQREGHLVSVKRIGLEDQQAELSRPQHAIWAVPGMRQMQILHDPQGLLQALQLQAQQFDWTPLIPQAEAFVSYQLAHTAEEIYKILGGLAAQNPSKVIYAVLGLGLSLAEAMAVHQRLLIESENEYLRTIYDSVGYSAGWSRAHRLAVGWKAGAFERRGRAALEVYWESFLAFQDVLEEEHLEVVQPALQAIQQSLWLK